MRSRGGTGRHAGLKILWPHGCTGSIPVGSTPEAEKARSVIPEGLFRFWGSEAK
jgi:hypothetical protein